MKGLKNEEDWEKPTYPQYYMGDEGLLIFEDESGRTRLCVPKKIQLEIMKSAHNKLLESAHEGYHKTYNRIASSFYWPRMS